MLCNSKLHLAAEALHRSAKPIYRPHNPEPDEYVVPRAQLEALGIALDNLHQPEVTHHEK